jgi:ABC-2 type transport system ATP-binding protein
MDAPSPDSGATLLTATDLTVAYTKGRPVLDSVSLALRGGRMTALLGPNGAGKSTLIHSLLGLVRSRSGAVTLNGMPLAALQTSHVGFCADDLPMPELLTGFEYTDLIQDLRGLAIPRLLISSFFESLRMDGAGDRLIGAYSHGMKRKVQLLANILHRPPVLILDEPFRGLDPETAAMLRELLRAYVHEGNIVLVSTHDLHVAEALCDDLLILNGGRIVADGAVADMMSEDPGRNLEERFLELTGLDSVVHAASHRFIGLMDNLPRVAA